MGIDTYFDGQLMYASLKITYKNKTKVIDKLVVDTGERVIIVTGWINALVSRVSGTLIKNNSCIAYNN